MYKGRKEGRGGVPQCAYTCLPTGGDGNPAAPGPVSSGNGSSVGYPSRQSEKLKVSEPVFIDLTGNDACRYARTWNG